MYLAELEQLVLEDENRIIENEKNLNSRLLRLQTDDEFRKNYYSRVNIESYSVENYNRLKNNYEKAFDRMDKLSYLNSKLDMLSIKSDKLSNKIDSLEMNVKIKKELLSNFDKEMSYMLYLGIISEKDALNKGFSPKYIKKLYKLSQKEIEAAYSSYLDDYRIDKEKVL